MEITITNKISILFFFSNDCIHCEDIQKKIRTTSFNIDIDLKEINIDDNKELGLKYSITHTPTMLVFKDEELISNIVGNDECLKALNNLFLL
jgi:thioredoxin-related protein